MKEYVVTCRSYEDLQSLYDDMETEGGSLYIPDRAVELLNRREISRNTHYKLTEDESALVKQDDRVLDVSLTVADMDNVSAKLIATSEYTKYVKGGDFTKDSTTPIAEQNNLQWGHLHSTGTTAQRRKGVWDTGEVNDTVEIFGNGKHVDIITVDGPIGYDSDEWISEDTGLTRMVQYDWFTNHSGFGQSGQYPYLLTANAQDHGMHVTGTAAGKWYGWAKEANIYNIDFNAVNTLYLYDAIREFHKNKATNSQTGVKNPTICNNSWGYFYSTPGEFSGLNSVYWNGTTYNSGNPNPSGWNDAGVAADFGIKPSTAFGFVNTAIEADIEDAIAEGVVIISAAGNSNHLCVRPQDPEYNNTMNHSGIGGNIYICRANSIAAAEGVICVGGIDTSSDFRRSTFSNFGPRIDVFAPATRILSVGGDGTYGSGLVGPITRAGYPAGVDRLWTASGTSMAAPQVSGIAACLATGRRRLTNDDIIGFIRSMSRDGDMTFDVNPTGNSSYYFYFDASTTSAYTITGTDYNGSVSGNNPTLTATVGDNFSLRQPQGYSFSAINGVQAASPPGTYEITVTSPSYSYYTLNGFDGTGAISGNDVTVTVTEGDTINFNLSNVDAVHPFYIRDAAGTSNVSSPAATGQGSTGTNTVSWTPTTAGTYSYICGNHSSMKGTITVLSSGPTGYLITVGDRVLNGSQGSQEDPTINIEYGDGLDMELYVDLTSHPIYIRDSSNNNVANVDGQGVTQPNMTIGWQSADCPAVGTYKYVCDNHPAMSGDIVIHPAGTYYDHPLYIKTVQGSGTGNQVSGATNQGALKGSVEWTPTTAGTYYYQCGNHSAMYGEIVIIAKPGSLGQAGNLDDNSCQQGSPNREIFCDNPRNKSVWKGGWKKDTLNGRRKTEPRDNGNRQIFPRTNTYFRP